MVRSKIRAIFWAVGVRSRSWRQSVKLLKKDLDALNQAIDENRSKRNALRDKIAALAEKLQKEYLQPEYGKNGDQPDGIPPGRDGFRNISSLKDEAVEIETQMAEIEEEKHRIRKSWMPPSSRSRSCNAPD